MNAPHNEHDAHPSPPPTIDALFQQLVQVAALSDSLPDADTAIGRTTREFFDASWRAASSGLLSRTTRLRVEPLQPSAPHVFRFEMDLPYKAQVAPGEPIETRPGPIRGTIRYRPDLFTADVHEPGIAVLLEPGQHLLHPNFSRRHGMLCIGDVPAGPFELEHLLEHLWSVLGYENLSTSDPADREAARIFAEDPDALDGLGNAGPLYE